MSKIKVATVQMSMSWNVEENIKKAENLIRSAAKDGAKIILLSELFERVYFCSVEKAEYMDFAIEIEKSPAINHFKKLAKELDVVLPISFYERRNNARYNCIGIIDATGDLLGIYRKSHIPHDEKGYEEKFYFNIGDTGFKVWNTKYGNIGVAICWDQWFPEAARCMALMGADILLYPTAIGSEPLDPTLDTKDHWQRVMMGHAAANIVPVMCANRVGTEVIDDVSVTFYGSSFITNEIGEKLSELNRDEEGYTLAEVDFEKARKYRAYWGLFRDRRPDLYGTILTLDGEHLFGI